MAHDFSSLPPELGVLSGEAQSGLLAALEQFVSQSGDDGSLRGALRRVTLEARERQIPPERLMIAFKALWERLPAVRDTTDPRMRARLLERLITASIQEYFAE